MPGLTAAGGFDPESKKTDFSTDHERALVTSPDTKWARKEDWHKQAVAAVREERQLVREADARRQGTEQYCLKLPWMLPV